MNVSIFKKYPPGFGGLFVTQACFNFSFYGLKSIFILYIISELSLSEKEAIGLFATCMALSYVSSLIGGWVADNSFGTKTTIISGGLLQALGIFALMFSSQDLCFLALALISLGSGFFKPTLATSVGMLFSDPKDPLKDKAYSTFYMAMNLGCFAAPLLCGFVSKTYGGYYNSLLLIIVTLLGGIYLLYTNIQLYKKDKMAFSKRYPMINLFCGILFIPFSILIFYFFFKYREIFSHLMGVIALGSVFYFAKIFYHASPEERKEVLLIIPYILFFTFFCTLFEQDESSLILFFEKVVDREVLGITIPASTFLSLGPIFVLIASPLFILFSEKILEKRTRIDGLIKIGIGFIFVSFSFLVLAWSCSQSGSRISSFWVVGALFIQTIGELWIVPIGFSNVSKLSSPRFRSTMMSFWLMAIAYGHYFAGKLAQFSLIDNCVPENLPNAYYSFFLTLAFLPLGVACLLFLYSFTKRKE